MKKIFALLVTVAMLASLCALTANAAVDEADWNPFGEVSATYDPDMSSKITLDGDVSDWQNGGFARYDIDQYNLDPWVGEVNENWSINLWFGADAEFLYIAFKINDSDVSYSNDEAYNMDAFQIQLDFNGWAAATENFERAVFYSFGLQEDGTVDMTVQCIYTDAASQVDYKMASDDDPEWAEGTVKGCTKKAEDGSGWFAEFAISWQTLYNDIANKLTNDELPVPEWIGGQSDVSLNMLVCYLDCSAETGGITGAWGTSHALGSLGGGDGWYPESAGMTLTITGMEDVTVETQEATTPEETEPADDGDDTTVADKETEDQGGDATTEAPAGEDTTAPAEEKKDCKSVIALPVVALVATVAVAFVAKKKD